MSTSLSNVSAAATIPRLFRIMLFYLEPLCAVNGAILVLVQPGKYIHVMTRGAVASIGDGTNFIYTELAGGWLHFVFTEAVVLRLVDDLRVWKLLCMGMLLSDVLYCHSCAQALGGWSVWLKVWQWTVEDWVVTVTTWPFMLARIAILLGIGTKARTGGSVEDR